MEKVITICAVFLFATLFFTGKYGKLQSKRDKKSKSYRIGPNPGEGFSIDFYAYNSKIRHWNSTFKVGFSVLVLFLCIGLDNPNVSIAVLVAMAYLTIVKGGLSVQEYLIILTLPLIFIFLGTFAIAFDFSKEPMGQYNLYLGFCYVFTSQGKLKEVGFMILKVFGSISALQMMTLSTPFSELTSVLRRVKVPKLIVELMSMIYRYIFILLEVHTKMKNSVASRLGYCDFKTSCYSFGNIAANILVISLKKANAYYDAMESRGFEGELIFLEEEKKVKPMQIIAAGAFMIFILLLWWLTT